MYFKHIRFLNSLLLFQIVDLASVGTCDIGEVVVTYDDWRRVFGWKLRSRFSFINLGMLHLFVLFEIE